MTITEIGRFDQSSVDRLTRGLRQDASLMSEARDLIDQSPHDFAERAFGLDAAQSRELRRVLPEDRVRLMGRLYLLAVEHDLPIRVREARPGAPVPRAFGIGFEIEIERDENGKKKKVKGKLVIE